MAIYEYRCEIDGAFEVSLPMGTAPEAFECSACGGRAQRIVSMPSVRTGARTAWLGAVDRARRSAHEPEVVTSPPPVRSSQRRVPYNPAWRGLPRP